MPLDKASLKSSLFEALKDEYSGTPSAEQEAGWNRIADKFSDAIDAFVKTGTVTVDPGIAVSTTGTAAAQTGATTAPGTGSIA